MSINISLQNIPDETQKEILRKNWQSHDGRWQFAMFTELGAEKGNAVNKQVAKAVYKGETYRLLKAFNITKVKNMISQSACFFVLLLIFGVVRAEAEWPHVVLSKDGTPISY